MKLRFVGLQIVLGFYTISGCGIAFGADFDPCSVQSNPEACRQYTGTQPTSVNTNTGSSRPSVVYDPCLGVPTSQECLDFNNANAASKSLSPPAVNNFGQTGRSPYDPEEVVPAGGVAAGTPNTGGSTTPAGSDASSKVSCEIAVSIAKQKCSGVNTSALGMSMVVGAVANGMSQAGTGVAAANANMLAGAATTSISVAMAQACQSAATQCNNSCTSSDASGPTSKAKADYIAQCESYAQAGTMAMYQAAAQGTAAVANGMAARNALNSSGGAAAPATAPNFGAPLPLATAPNAPAIPADIPSTQAGYTKIGNGALSNTGTEGNGSGGFSGNNPDAMNAGGGNNSQGGGSSGSALNNPTLGVNNGSGGGYSVSGVPVSGGGGGYNYGGRGGSDPQAIDLSKFLPGQERVPASNGSANPMLAAQGVSASEGLSNFEKVSRVMRKRTPYMRQ